MRRPLEAISSTASISTAVLLFAITLAGCGSSGGSGSGGSGSRPKAVTATIPLTSPAIEGSEIPARYTCDGANIAPPLRWGEVAVGIQELVLFALGVEPGKPTRTATSVEWAMGGIKPELHEISAGELPHGAVLEQASDGKRHYSICPPKGQTKHYVFAVYAVPPLIRVGSRVTGINLFRNLTEGIPQYRAPEQGKLLTSYTRK